MCLVIADVILQIEMMKKKNLLHCHILATSRCCSSVCSPAERMCVHAGLEAGMKSPPLLLTDRPGISAAFMSCREDWEKSQL